METGERDRDRRPDPDALLALSGNAGRGRLRVFLGAAPGVGKTYAMLQGARRRKAEGAHVLLGLVETHGRKETEELIHGLDILPRRAVDYQGRVLLEFDLDGALARRPDLLIVDELAHTNAPGSRHPKRWQDIAELLDHGVDVWTAVNVQHLESLADVVSRITGVHVRETVPDVFMQEADDVVVVDITPEELIQRLHEGKVYVPATARRATQNFFTPGNLTALRELALRRTAERVDDQVVEYLRQKAIEGPWETSDRLLVCVGSAETAETIVRKAARLASGLNATWIALHLERPDSPPADVAQERAIADALALAERLGAETNRIAGNDFVTEIVRFARRENVTQILIGRSSAGLLSRLIGRSLPDQVIRAAGEISVQVVASQEARGPEWSGAIQRAIAGAGAGLDGLFALIAVAIALAVAHGVAIWERLPNLSMVFLAAVLTCAALRGARAGIFAAVLSFLAYNFFFIEPLYTLTIAEPHEVLALLIYLAVAMLTGSLAGRLRQQSLAAQARARSTLALYEFSRRIAAASKDEEITAIVASHIHRVLGLNCVLLLPKDDDLELAAAWPPTELSDAAEFSAARWAFERSEPAGWLTGTLPSVRFQFRPLSSPRANVGVLAVAPAKADARLSSEQESMLATIAEQTAIALDRAFLMKEAMKAATLEQNETVRDALLASLSHDLRTPLASITGAASSLRELGGKMSVGQRDELVASIEQEAARLSRFVTNLLEMSRIEAGALKVKRDWVDVADVVRTTAERASRTFAATAPRISIADDLPFVRGDANLLQQVVFNLIDNAYKYGAADEPPSVHARREGGEVVISVTDSGPGVKPENLERIFEKFYRGGGADGRSPGTGLGLSICRGIVQAMGGRVLAQSPAARRKGMRIIVRLPAAPAEGGASR